MPYKTARPCLYAGCTNTVQSGYCQTHAHFYNPPERAIDQRPSAASRGYDRVWQLIRAKVLRDHGIPADQWHEYDIHHEPPYNPQVEPRHTAYKLTPLLRSDHSKVTARRMRQA